MRLLVFAHTPPPHHGQSFMVKLMLDGFGGDRRKHPHSEPRNPDYGIECYHVNCRYSQDFEDIGSFRLGKIWLVLRYCAEAIWCRFRYGVRAFYYVPAPGKRAALYRDWTVMLLCRPFFKHFIHHWHAAGLVDWLVRDGSPGERWVTHHLLDRPSLGIVLAAPCNRDALAFCSRRVEIVSNGIPDLCPDFQEVILPRRQSRLRARRALIAGGKIAENDRPRAGDESGIFRVLFLAHCIREKGLFDALEGVALLSRRLADEGSGLRVQFEVAGAFPGKEKEVEFRQRIAQLGLADAVSCLGFVSAEQKVTLLRESDCLCFPTFYAAEGQPVILIEALAAGLSIVTTRWRAIPEILPPDYPGFVAASEPKQIAAALTAAAVRDEALALRERFLESFVSDRHLARLSAALLNATHERSTRSR